MDKPLVSVVIPTYSRPIFLKRCVDSVLAQTYENIEIFVVDDNNPDTEARKETELVMAGYKGDSNVTYLQHERNKNGSAARNTGWRASKGEYITFLDDDDMIETTKIEKQVECLENLDDTWGACYTGYDLIKEKGKNQVSAEKRCGDCYVDALMRTLFMGSGSNLFLRKSVVDEINGYDESFRRNQDIEFMVRALEHYKLAYIDEVLLHIFQEGMRVNRSFEEVDSYAIYYLDKFKNRIEKLNERDKKRVISVISLERFRVALSKRNIAKGMQILIDNNVSCWMLFKYVLYLIRRVITGQSYGFYG